MEWRRLQRRSAAAALAAWLRRRLKEARSQRAGMGTKVDAAPKRTGIVVAEAIGE